MSGVYIKMKMPKNCTKCPFFIKSNSPKYPFVDCKIIGRLGSVFNCIGIPVDCPLVELPPHGDLIDRDALIKDGWLNLHKEVMWMGGYAIHELPLKNPSIPVIIPAEEGET